jgi:energy-coupling factor transport system substrate-specific component
MRQLVTGQVVRPALVAVPGLALFFWPFLPGAPAEAPAAALALGSLLAVVLLEVGARRLDSRGLALLAAIAAVDAGLRLAVVIGIGGFSPFFFLVLCAGWVFGPSYGFLCGAFALLVSALATGGVTPWVPYQVFGVGYVGVVAGLAGRWRSPRFGWRDAAVLAAVGVLTGFAYGALTDIQVWVTGFRGPGELGWQPGLAPATALLHFARFYAVTSLVYDSFRAGGNAAMVLLLAAPVVAALERVRARFSFEVVPVPA